MPLYDAECQTHGLQENVWGGINEQLMCPDCKAPMKRLITATRVSPDWEPYLEENMGTEPVMIQSRQHYYQELKARGLQPKNDTRG